MEHDVYLICNVKVVGGVRISSLATEDLPVGILLDLRA